MERLEEFKPHDVILVADYPIKAELDSDVPWSAATHLDLLNDLAKVGVKQVENIGTAEDIVLREIIHKTYLSYARPERFDFQTSFVRKIKDIPEGKEFIKIPWETNVWVDINLWNEFMALRAEIEQVKPKLILVIGKWSLYFLSGGRVPYSKTQGTKINKKPLGGLATHRASVTPPWNEFNLENCLIFPMLPTTEKWRSLNEHRVKTENAFTFIKWDMEKFGEIYAKICKENYPTSYYLYNSREYIFGTSLVTILTELTKLENELNNNEVVCAVDIETRHNSIDCIGLSYRDNSGICVPFSTIENPIPWSYEDEFTITTKLLDLLNHKNMRIVGQNFAYDSQYINKFLLTKLETHWDTMICNHVLYNTLKKDLATLASVYCEKYQYWKDSQTHGKEGN